MSLRINTNVEAINVHRNLTMTNRRLAESLKRLSSGYRINSAKDDASGLAVANKFRADIQSLRVAKQNAMEAQSMLQVADGAYTKIYDILVRMKELATQAASSQTVQNQLVSEFQYLQSEIDRIAGSTLYNKTLLISTSNSGPGTTKANASATDGLTFQIGQLNDGQFRLNLTLDKADATSLGVSSAGSGAIAISDVAAAQNAMDKIDSAIESINQYMAKVGAYQNRLQYSIENLEVSIENFSASESTIRDVDMAWEVMNFTKQQILQQSGMAMLAQANMAPQQILQLLG
ncbi:flagellin [Thermodesulforhabdus norvegica]|uniref:Flagellin n=1 Tax=Thermodesulforhabdus norvegica TaxID=39841 RepID=A0A1I4QTM6_9BACT|nr:flagellin [Thermodesulforhabdus norvegica]SFM43070.1 flagellin [Thermodesulforhabdus norvegica]